MQELQFRVFWLLHDSTQTVCLTRISKALPPGAVDTVSRQRARVGSTVSRECRAKLKATFAQRAVLVGCAGFRIVESERTSPAELGEALWQLPIRIEIA